VRRPTAFAVAAALLVLAATPALSSANPGSNLRGRLIAALQKTAAAESLIARATGELRESRGYVTTVIRIDEEGPEAELYVVETFTGFDRSFGIAPPPANAIVQAPVKEVTSQSEFSDLLGPPPFGDD
jgi:hypothetical protein